MLDTAIQLVIVGIKYFIEYVDAPFFLCRAGTWRVWGIEEVSHSCMPVVMVWGKERGTCGGDGE